MLKINSKKCNLAVLGLGIIISIFLIIFLSNKGSSLNHVDRKGGGGFMKSPRKSTRGEGGAIGAAHVDQIY